MINAYVLFPLETMISMELTGSDQRFTGLYLIELSGILVLISGLGFHLDG